MFADITRRETGEGQGITRKNSVDRIPVGVL